MYDFLLDAPLVRVQSAEFIAPIIHGARSTDPKPYNWGVPKPIFLIYISRTTNDKWIYRHMFAEYVPNHQDMVNELYDLAKSNANTPYRVGNSLVNLIWQQPCHVYLVMDLENSTFIPINHHQFDPLQFKPEKPILRPGPVTMKYYDENRSFYDGIIETVRSRSAFHCINYFKDDAGNDIKYPQVRSYCLLIAYQAPDVHGVLNLHTIDPDGQNQGPPSLVLELDTVPA